MPAGLAHEAVDLAQARDPFPCRRSLVVKNGSKARSSVARVHAGAGVRDRDHDILARLHRLGQRADIGLVEIAVGGLDRDLAAVGHGVARVERQIEQRVLELVGVGKRAPEAARQHRFQAIRSRRACRRRNSQMPPTSLLASIDFGSSGCWRENASSRLVSVAARRTPSSAMSLPRTMRAVAGEASSAGSCRPIMSSPPSMMVSRLLKSCATPPVSWPTASIFCACRSGSSALLARFVLGFQLPRALLDGLLPASR